MLTGVARAAGLVIEDADVGVHEFKTTAPRHRNRLIHRVFVPAASPLAAYIGHTITQLTVTGPRHLTIYVTPPAQPP